jgi:hypothetical protein
LIALVAFGAGSACCAGAGSAKVAAMTVPKASRLPNRRFVMSIVSVSGC